MKLNCLERIVTLQLLANYKEGSFLTFNTLKKLRAKIGFTENEVKEFELKEENGQYSWDIKGNEPVEIEISEMEDTLISDTLIQLDKDEKLTPLHLTLYEKFINKEN